MDRIFKESGGSPLFTIEVLRMLMSEGRLVEKNGTYMMAGDGRSTSLKRIQGVISRRMDKLSKEQREFLTVHQ